MSQSLHAIPAPHFGCHFDGLMNVKPFAQQQETEGINLNKKKPVTHVAEHDQKEDVKAEHQLQEKAQGFETKKSSTAPESDAEDGTDVKRLKYDFTDNNKNQSASDDIKPLGARPLQEVINARRISQGRKPITKEEYLYEINHLEHCPKCRSFWMPEPPRTTACYDLLAPLFRHPAKPETDGSIRNLLNRLRPEHPPPIDPQKAWDNFYKIHPHLKRPAFV